MVLDTTLPAVSYLHLKHEFIASDTKLRLKQNGELLFSNRFGPSSVRSLDPLQRLQGYNVRE